MGEISELRVEVPGLDQYFGLGKSKVAHVLQTHENIGFNVEHCWDNEYDILEIRVNCKNNSTGSSEKKVYVVVYDINYTTVLALYDIKVHSYPLLSIVNAPKNAET